MTRPGCIPVCFSVTAGKITTLSLPGLLNVGAGVPLPHSVLSTPTAGSLLFVYAQRSKPLVINPALVKSTRERSVPLSAPVLSGKEKKEDILL